MRAVASSLMGMAGLFLFWIDGAAAVSTIYPVTVASALHCGVRGGTEPPIARHGVPRARIYPRRLGVYLQIRFLFFMFSAFGVIIIETNLLLNEVNIT